MEAPTVDLGLSLKPLNIPSKIKHASRVAQLKVFSRRQTLPEGTTPAGQVG